MSVRRIPAANRRAAASCRSLSRWGVVAIGASLPYVFFRFHAFRCPAVLGYSSRHPPEGFVRRPRATRPCLGGATVSGGRLSQSRKPERHRSRSTSISSVVGSGPSSRPASIQDDLALLHVERP